MLRETEITSETEFDSRGISKSLHEFNIDSSISGN